MPEIRGFRGWRYNAAKIKDGAAVVAPPYDVISPKEQDALYRRHPYNVIRLELTKAAPGQDKYREAAATLEEWKESGVLTREERPAIYVCRQDYKEEGKARTRLGFYAAMKVDERAVKKHENTLAGPKADRLELLKATGTNLSPIFGLFEDPKGIVQRTLKEAVRGKRPVFDVTTPDGVRHRLYVETDTRRMERVRRAMGPKPMFIADGHHRFETACNYRRFMVSGAARSAAKRQERDAAWNYVMTYFTDCRNNPFTIWPTHRLVKFPASLKDAGHALAKLGSVERVSGLPAVLEALSATREEADDDRYSFGFYSRKDKRFLLLTLGRALHEKVGRSAVDKLDVSVLHRFVIEPVFKISKIEKSEAIDFTRDAKDAVRRVDAGEYDAALFLRPTSLAEMIAASKKGLKMPQKSTYFWPKLLTGLVFHGPGA